MTDLEITKLCAEAMGLQHHVPRDAFDGEFWVMVIGYSIEDIPFVSRYDPLHDDAQSMALEDWLTKRGTLVKTATKVTFTHDGTGETWSWLVFDNTGRRAAVCECVATMMAKP